VNFGGFPPGGAFSQCTGALARCNDPTSLAVSLRLLLSVFAFIYRYLEFDG